MKNYRSAEKALKVGVENIWVLHHKIAHLLAAEREAETE